MKPNDIFNIDEAMMAGGRDAYATETKKLQEVDPRNFDSDEDYYAALKAPKKPRYHGTQSPGVNPDDEAYFREIWRKKREAAKKAEQDKDQGVAEDTGKSQRLPSLLSYIYSKSQNQFSDFEELEDLFDYAYLDDVDLQMLAQSAQENGVSAQKQATSQVAWLLKNIKDKSYLKTIKPLAVQWIKLVSPALDDYIKNVLDEQGVAEDAEYDDEAGMVDNNLATLERAIEGIDEIVEPGSNLPEWCQEKIAQAKGMLVNVWDYMKSEEENGHMAEDWQKANRKDKTDGLSQKAVNAYRREHPGSKLKTAVTTKPSKLKKGSKDANRRKSFCARMGGMPGPMKDEHGKPTPKAKALARWNCEESAIPDYEAMFESQLNEFASCGGTGGIATSMAVGNPAAGSLFGGSYSQKNSPFKKTAKKRTGKIIKR